MQIFPTGPAPATVMLVGEFPRGVELQKGAAFSDYAGEDFARMLREAGIDFNSCYRTAVIKQAVPGNDIGNLVAMKKSAVTPAHVNLQDKFVLPLVRDSLQTLQREIELVNPTVIIALGNLALWALTSEWGITKWRGSVLPCNLFPAAKVIPTFSPVMVQRQHSWRPIAVQDLRRAKRESGFRGLNVPDYKFVIRPDLSQVLSILHQLFTQLDSGSKKLAVDIETRAGHIACIGLGWSKLEALCIPLMCVEKPEGYWSLEDETLIVYALYQLLTHPNIEVVGQNFHYDAQYFVRHLMFNPRLVRDTMLSQHALFANMQKGLDFLSSMYCEYHAYWKDEGKEWSKDVNEDQLWEYNCKDCVITFEVDDVLQATVDAMGLREVHDFQQTLYHPVLDTMLRGIRVDQASRGQFALELQSAIAEREQWLNDTLGREVNIRSPKQMQELFYHELGQKSQLNRKSGTVTTDDEALRKLGEREPLLLPLTQRIQELRSLGVFLSTFVNAPLDVDSRIRCSFNIAGTETYRFSSRQNAFGSGLNLQNIPSGGEAGDNLSLPNVRSLFIPDPGYTFFDIDLSSADLRIVVWEADEPEFKEMLKAGLDPYTEIAKEFYRDPTITKADPRRQTFKGFAHGTNYLGTARGLAERIGLSVAEAERTQKWYFDRFPRIKKWQDDLKDQVIKRRMVENVFGYRCYFFDRIEGTIFNQAAAWIPQSTVACLINRAYVNVHKNLPEVQVLLQVHDSLAGQFPTHLGEPMMRKIIQQAEIELPYPGDPLTIPVGVKTSTKSWGECG